MEAVQKKFGAVELCMEAFSGTGFIGFALLAQGLCRKLILTDINQKALDYCEKTIVYNGLADKVTAYRSDCFDSIPEMKVDLIVGNPPHSWTASEEVREKDIRTFDPHMRIHKKFYNQAKNFLKPNGNILLWEDIRATKPEDFYEMIEESGLKFIDYTQVNIHVPFSWRKFITLKNGEILSKNYFRKINLEVQL